MEIRNLTVRYVWEGYDCKSIIRSHLPQKYVVRKAVRQCATSKKRDKCQRQIASYSLVLGHPKWSGAFDPSMLDEQLKNILDQCLSEVILVSLSPEQSVIFGSFITHLYTVYDDQTQLFRQTIIQSMVTAFVYQIASFTCQWSDSI